MRLHAPSVAVGTVEQVVGRTSAVAFSVSAKIFLKHAMLHGETHEALTSCVFIEKNFLQFCYVV